MTQNEIECRAYLRGLERAVEVLREAEEMGEEPTILLSRYVKRVKAEYEATMPHLQQV